MAGQGSVSKLISLLGTCKNLLNSRPLSLGYQQSFGIRQAVKDRLKDINVPEKPKKPLTPYLRYFTQELANVRKDNPKASLVEIAKKCSVEWKQCDPNVKQEYESKFRDDIEIYTKQIQEYHKSLSPEQTAVLKELRTEKLKDKKKRQLRKAFRKNNKPKKPLTPYLSFMLSYMKNNPGKLKDVIPKVAKAWIELPEEEKRKLQVKYEDERLKYNAELSEWESRMIKLGNVELVRVRQRPLVSRPANKKKAVKKLVKKTNKVTGKKSKTETKKKE